MSEIVSINKKGIREDIMALENAVINHAGSFIGDSEVCPLKHSFSDGMYVREIFIPAGTILVGKIHKHAHPNFLMKGEVEVITESNKREHLVAPLSMISPSGTKRVVRAITDTVWVTVHENKKNTTNLKNLEEEIISPDYVSYQKFIDGNAGTGRRMLSFVKTLFKKLLK